MTTFPLYDSLIKDIPKKDLTMAQKEDFIQQIEIMDEAGKDLIYTLIQIYNIKNEATDGKSPDNLPYNGIQENLKKGKANLTWNFTEFPIPLRNILYKFVMLHIQKMSEESDRQKLQK